MLGKILFFSLGLWLSVILFLGSLPSTSSIRCYCDICKNSSYSCESDGICMAYMTVANGENKKAFRCFEKNHLEPPFHPMVCESGGNSQFVVHCCGERDYCNRDIVLEMPTVSSPPGPSGISRLDELRWIFPIAIAASFVVFVGLVYFLRRRKCFVSNGSSESSIPFMKESSERTDEDLERNYPNEPARLKIEDIIQRRVGADSSGASGSGLPLLEQRTVARTIALREIIGKGRYGEVWSGKWRDIQVAVKIMHSRDEIMWKNETGIYQKVMLRHNNILGFIAADNKDTGMVTQLWIVFEYCENHSLTEYLMANTIEASTMIRMAYGIANGLCHLHMDIVGTDIYQKPSIAHCDLKSRNILVRRDLECVIGDLGMAVYQEANSGELIAPPKSLGTKRYMAPEILDETFNRNYFDSYKRSDIYSLALVFWELLSRFRIHDPTERKEDKFMLPYGDVAPNDPTTDEMHQIVVVEKLRPPLPAELIESDPSVAVLSRLINESWHHNPAARLTASRVRKTLFQELEKLETVKA